MDLLHLTRTKSNGSNSLNKTFCITTSPNWNPIQQSFKKVPITMRSSTTSICWWITFVRPTHRQRPIWHRSSKIARSPTTCSGLCSSQISTCTQLFSMRKSQLVTGMTPASRRQQVAVFPTFTSNAAVWTLTDKSSAKVQLRLGSEHIKEQSQSTGWRHIPLSFIGTKKR